MKAQRRHELQTNALAKVITRAPSFWAQYGGRMLLVLAAALIVALLVRYRISSSRESADIARQSLAIARSSIVFLRQGVVRPEALQRDASTALEQVLENTDDPNLVAEALIARGDLNWTMATLPSMAPTQALVGRDPEQLLRAAEEAYATVIDRYPEQKNAIIAAHFGLAGIAENRGQWDPARRHYEAVANDESAPQAYRQQAQFRLDRSSQWQRPILIVEPTAPTTTTTAPTTSLAIPFVDVSAFSAEAAPATAPATTQSTTAP